MAWLSGYAYREPLVLTGGASGAQTDFQISIAVAHVAAKMQADFDDIRFTRGDGTTLIDAWLESYVADTSAKIWVEFPTTPANTVEQTYYMYYGKADAVNYWDGDKAFSFYDHFEGTTLDTSKWSDISVGGAFGDDVSGSTITLEGSDYPQAGGNGEGIETVNGVISSPTIATIRYRGLVSCRLQLIHISNVFMWGAAIYYNPSIYYREADGAIYYTDVGGWYDPLHIRSFTTDWHTTSIQLSGTELKYIENGSAIGTGNEATTGIQNFNIILGSWASGGGSPLEVDYVYVRKYAANPPTYAFGAGEEAGAIMNQFQRASIGADLYNGALAI